MQPYMMLVIDSPLELALSPYGSLVKWLEAYHFSSCPTVDFREVAKLAVLTCKELTQELIDHLVSLFREKGFTGTFIVAGVPKTPAIKPRAHKALCNEDVTHCIHLGTNKYDSYHRLSICAL